MERDEAVKKLKELEGLNLGDLLQEYQVTHLTPKGTVNKGWAGHVIERYLGLPLNSSRAPNFGSWELKVIPLKILSNGLIVPKETMAITMLDAVEVAQKEFYDSHLYNKLSKVLIVARLDSGVLNSTFVKAVDFDLHMSPMLEEIVADYTTIRNLILAKQPLSGRIGKWIQPRTKGAGHGSTSRAFYARTGFLKSILDL